MRAELVWHEVECGPYAGDLALWRQLAAEAAGPVLELGCGSGRVALDLARAGRGVTGVDTSAELVAELRRRAADEGVEVEAIVADVRRLELGRRFALAIAPMQLVHLLGGPHGRAEMLACVHAHLTGGGRLTAALLPEEPLATGADAPAPLPDVREIDGWIYSSLPVEVRATPTGLEVRRLRQIVSPAGALEEEVDVTRLERLSLAELVAEAERAGFAAVDRLEVPPTRDHIGSTVAVLEAR